MLYQAVHSCLSLAKHKQAQLEKQQGSVSCCRLYIKVAAPANYEHAGRQAGSKSHHFRPDNGSVPGAVTYDAHANGVACCVPLSQVSKATEGGQRDAPLCVTMIAPLPKAALGQHFIANTLLGCSNAGHGHESSNAT